MHKLFVAVPIMLAALFAGCSSAWGASSALSTYVDRAHDSVERCKAAALERASAASQCANDAQRQIEPFYDAAAISVRWQRGTSMYLSMHHTKWTQVMQRLSDADSALTGETLTQEIELLRMLEQKLVQ